MDIGTLERFAYKPIQLNGEIISLDKINDTVSVAGVGLERLCIVANGLERIHNVDFIRPFYDAMPKIENRFVAGESLRALHQIYSDAWLYNIPEEELRGSQRKKRINRMIRNVLESGLNEEEIQRLLQINAQNQPWHHELRQGIELAVEKIKDYKFSQEK